MSELVNYFNEICSTNNVLVQQQPFLQLESFSVPSTVSTFLIPSTGKRSYNSTIRNLKDPAEKKKKAKTLLCNEHILEVFTSRCCDNECIKNQFAYNEVKKILEEWACKSEHQKSKDLASLLQILEIQHPSSSIPTSTVGGHHFELKLNGKPVCNRAFQKLLCISRGKEVAALEAPAKFVASKLKR